MKIHLSACQTTRKNIIIRKKEDKVHAGMFVFVCIILVDHFFKIFLDRPKHSMNT